MRISGFLFILFLSVFHVSDASAGTPRLKNNRPPQPQQDEIHADKRDSSSVVAYHPKKKFIPDPSHSATHYSAMIDSLVQLDTLPVSLINQLNVYRNLSRYAYSDLPLVIDSIFENPSVPKTVLAAVSTYVQAMESKHAAPSGFYAHVPASSSLYPAHHYYGDWNTNVPFPERNKLSEFDSTLTLLLVDEAMDCGFMVPFEGNLTSHFGWRWGRNHNGTDLDLEVWDPVKSAFAGVVRVARSYKGYGRVVVIRHYNGLETLYAHLHRFKVKTGDVVEAGDVIGLGGSSGNSTGSHLHFEVRFQGVPINPASFINFRSGTLKNTHIQLQKEGAFLAVAKPNKVIVKETWAASNATKLYEVKKGDYLYKIAREYGVSVDEICTTNQLQPDQPLHVGQKLRLGT